MTNNFIRGFADELEKLAVIGSTVNEMMGKQQTMNDVGAIKANMQENMAADPQRSAPVRPKGPLQTVFGTRG